MIAEGKDCQKRFGLFRLLLSRADNIHVAPVQAVESTQSYYAGPVKAMQLSKRSNYLHLYSSSGIL